MVSMDCLDDENPIVVVLSLTHARKNRLGCKDFLDSFLFLIFSVIKKKSVFWDCKLDNLDSYNSRGVFLIKNVKKWVMR